MQAASARAFLRRLYPWLGRAVHARWSASRTFYRVEAEALLLALARQSGTVPNDLRLRFEGFLGKLYREWFPRDWRKEPTFAEIVRDFRWWLAMAERWGEPQPKAKRARPRSTKPPVDQPEELLRLLSLPADCTPARFLAAWRRFVKHHHPDLNPDQTPEERRRFAEAVALRRR